MDTSIETIIRGIPRNVAFDAHYVIDTLIRDYSDVYLNYATTMGAQDGITPTMHSQISRRISQLEGSLIANTDMQSWSYNIRGRASECKLWRRI